MLPRSLRHRSPLLWLVLPFGTGLVTARCGWALPVLPCLLLALAGALAAVLCQSSHPRIWPWALLASLWLAGIGAYQLERRRLPSWEPLPPREARLRVRCDRIFASDLNDRVAALATVLEADVHIRDLLGQRIYLGLRRESDEATPIRSSELRVIGLLSRVAFDPPPYDFERYLSDAGINFRLARGRVLATTAPPNAYYRFCAAAERRFSRILGVGAARDHPSLIGVLRAMLLGQQHELSDQQNKLFIQTGTMHLFAISGLHIVVIAYAIDLLLGLFVRNLSLRLLCSILLLWLYVDITGAAPSAIRAFVMVAVSQVAFLVWRCINPLATLTFSTALVLLVAPMQGFSASFQMSYGIVAALVLLGVPLAESWAEAWQPYKHLPHAALDWRQQLLGFSWRALTSSIALGLASTLIGAISGVSYFRLLSPISLFVNLVMIPASSLVILAGFASLVVGLFGCLPLAALFNHAGALVVAFLEWCAQSSLRIPGSSLPAEFRIPWLGGCFLTAILASCFWGYATRWERPRGHWWPPFVITALALAFAMRYGAP